MVDLILSLTNEQFAVASAVVAADSKKTDEERVTAYFQTQVDSIAAQFVDIATARRLSAKGLPAMLTQIGLKEDELAALEAFVDAKPRAAQP